jgi:hypothetical protein
MPQNLLNRLLVSAALVLFGLAIAIYVRQTMSAINPPLNGWFAAVLWLAGGTMAGAGLFAPFRMTSAGIVVGFVVQLIALLAMFLYGLQGLGGLSG